MPHQNYNNNNNEAQLEYIKPLLLLSNNNNNRQDHLSIGATTSLLSSLQDICQANRALNCESQLVLHTTYQSDNAITEFLPNLEHSYENLKFDLSYNKNLLLHKYFGKTTISQAPPVIYENLCRGCGYGVFEATGQLCNFCECIVNGVKKASSISDDDYYSANIYENVCCQCRNIYNGEKCENCDVIENKTLNRPQSEVEIKPKIERQKSWGKPEKKNFLQDFFGSLKRSKPKKKHCKETEQQAASTPCTPLNGKKLNIVHHVDGFDNVFHTQTVFDLKRICELKQAQQSQSEQHIYGRLKLHQSEPILEVEDECRKSLSHSVDQLSTTSAAAAADHQSIDCAILPIAAEIKSKTLALPKRRARISKFRLLGKLKNSKQPILGNTPPAAQQSLYLPDSVCHWMTSLRKETHNYCSFGTDINDLDIILWKIKSIPGKNSPYYAAANVSASEAAPATVTNYTNIEENLLFHKTQCLSDNSLNSSSESVNEIVTLRRANSSKLVSPELSEHNKKTPVAQMLHDFKQNLMAKQANRVQELELGSAAVAMKTLTGLACQKSKRQAIYLKLEDHLSTAEIMPNIHNNNELTAKEGQLVGNCCIEQAQQPHAAKTHSTESHNINQPLSCTTALQAFTCGEKNFEIVTDILNTFNLISQNKTEVNNSRQTTNCFQEHTTAVDTCAVQHSQQLTHFSSTPSLQIDCLISALLLSSSLNTLVIYYDKPLKVFLNNTKNRSIYCQKYAKWPAQDLVKKYQRFVKYCESLSGGSKKQSKQLVKISNSGNCMYISESVLANNLQVPEAVDNLKNTTNECEIIANSNKQVLKELKRQESQAEIEKEASECVKNIKEFEIQKKILQKSEIPQKVEHTKTADPPQKEAEVAETTPLSHKQFLANISYKSNITKENVMESYTNITQTEIKQLKPIRPAPKPPQVPVRDPKTSLSTAQNSNSMTVGITTSASSAVNSKKTTKDQNDNQSSKEQITKASKDFKTDDEGIYQPIWKFKTVGEAQEHYRTDADYYELPLTNNNNNTAAATTGLSHDSCKNLASSSTSSPTPARPTICITNSDNVNDDDQNNIEDQGEWETDDEFMFATQLDCNGSGGGGVAAAGDSVSINSVHTNSSSSLGSTVTGFASSTATFASAISSSLKHHLYCNIGIFYCLSEPKIRAIVYDYDRVHASTYFAMPQPLKRPAVNQQDAIQSLPVPPPRTSSANKTTTTTGESDSSTPTTMSPPHLLPDSVQAWKFMLLAVDYLEDEEDMIVSENQILRSQEIKEDIDIAPSPRLSIAQRFKSVSIGNLIDLPNDQDKKSIAERIRNKVPSRVFKLPTRSPKSEKKGRGLFRRAEATSLYLEEGLSPKYPIFGATLDELELNFTTFPHVPRFVVDCVSYIERKDCIEQDGLYRASGNKISIDELKQKLTQSYIYDPKLLVIDDIHTLTSLLKQFFRELKAPLIPQESYVRLPANLLHPNSLESMRLVFAEMKEPNRSTLRFLIKHLTNVAAQNSANRMPASNLAIVWGPCILSVNPMEFDIGRMNTLAKVLIENYKKIFISENERLVS